MCKEKVGYKIKDSSDLKNVVLDLLSNKKELKIKQKRVIEIINNKKGATKIIWDEVKKLV